MSGDRSNVSSRVLNARQTTQGHDSSLRNTYGKSLPDGAQCWVIDKQSNYRFLKESVLHPDGDIVVEPIDRQGRWVRETSLVGFAQLGGGKVADGVFQNYESVRQIQFACDKGRVMYTGEVPRAATLRGTLSPVLATPVLLFELSGSPSRSVVGDEGVVMAAVVLVPGECVSLHVSAMPPEEQVAELRGTLVIALS